jgi:hypothetical protein
MSERTTVRLPSDVLTRAKRKAAAEGRTLTSLVEEGLRLVIAERAGSGTRKRTLPRISKASGGLIPGVDLTSAAALQEIDDIERLARGRK